MNVSVAIAIRIIRQISRDRRTLGMVIVMPMIIALLFGYALQGETKNNPVVIVNLDTEPVKFPPVNETIGNNTVEFLKNDDRVKIIDELSDFEEARNMVLDLKAKAAILLPENLTLALFRENQSKEIIVFVDDAEKTSMISILTAVNEAFNNAVKKLGLKELPITIHKEIAWGDEELTGFDLTLPAISSYIIFFLIVLLALLLLVRENIEGTKMRFYASPINKWQIMFGYLLGITVFSIIIMIVVITILIGIYGATIRGNFFIQLGYALMFLTIYAIGSTMFSILISRVVKNELQAVQMAALIAISSMTLAGFLVPVETLPKVLQPISKIIPMTYAIEGLRSLFSRGLGMDKILNDIYALIVFAVVFFLLSIITTKETVA